MNTEQSPAGAWPRIEEALDFAIDCGALTLDGFHRLERIILDELSAPRQPNSTETPEPPCYRERDGGPGDDSWGCLNDHTGCFYNDGNNTCGHPGESSQPLEEEETG